MKFFKNIFLVIVIVSITSCKEKEEANVAKTDEVFIEEHTTAVEEEEKNKFVLDNLLKYNSEAELKEAFKGKVKRVKGYYPEGMGVFLKTVLYPGTKNEVEFIWKDDSLNFNQLLEVKVHKKNTDWKTKEGITIGTNLKALEKLNKKAFSFYGFEWDYGGMASWDDGALLNRNIAINLALPETIDFADYEKLLGESQFKSSSEIAQKVNPTVRELSLIKKEEE